MAKGEGVSGVLGVEVCCCLWHAVLHARGWVKYQGSLDSDEHPPVLLCTFHAGWLGVATSKSSAISCMELSGDYLISSSNAIAVCTVSGSFSLNQS